MLSFSILYRNGPSLKYPTFGRKIWLQIQIFEALIGPRKKYFSVQLRRKEKDGDRAYVVIALIKKVCE